MEHIRTFGPEGDPTNPSLWRSGEDDPEREFVLIDGDGKMIYLSREGFARLAEQHGSDA